MSCRFDAVRHRVFKRELVFLSGAGPSLNLCKKRLLARMRGNNPCILSLSLMQEKSAFGVGGGRLR